MNTSKQKTLEFAYLILRLTMGVDMFTHGLARALNLDGFHARILGEFSQTILPTFMLDITSYIIPFTELVVGILLIIGLFTNRALLLGGLLITLLVFGSGMKESWNSMSSQIIYAIYFFILSYFIEMNRFSIDSFKKKCC